MTYPAYFVFLSLFTMPSLCLGQQLSEHQWQDRVVLVFGSGIDVHYYQEQIRQLSIDTIGMNERKLVTYQIQPDKYNVGFADDRWIQSNKIYQEWVKSDTDFEVILIGLDGELKLRQKTPIGLQELFALIDGMPMRKKELRTRH